MHLRIEQALKELQIIRRADTKILCVQRSGKGMFDSEGFPAHPAPLPELTVNDYFVNTWGKYAGHVKFARTHTCGPKYPKFSDWIDSVDAEEPLYFHAALPVYAGLICLGYFDSGDGPQGEWVRASDVALVGIALYVDDELQPGFKNPPLEKDGLEKYGHECCLFIPGCASTYLADMSYVGDVFCLAPADGDNEIRDDAYNIEAYHQILKEYAKRNQEEGRGRDILITVTLVLSTSYLANVRKVCSGQIRVTITEHGIKTARARVKDALENRIFSMAAKYPRRPRKVLSEMIKETDMNGEQVDKSNTENNPRMNKLVKRNEWDSSKTPKATPAGGASAQGVFEEPVKESATDSAAQMQDNTAGRSPKPTPQGTPLPWDVRKMQLGGSISTPVGRSGDGPQPPPPPQPRESPAGAGTGL